MAAPHRVTNLLPQQRDGVMVGVNGEVPPQITLFLPQRWPASAGLGIQTFTCRAAKLVSRQSLPSQVAVLPASMP